MKLNKSKTYGFRLRKTYNCTYRWDGCKAVKENIHDIWLIEKQPVNKKTGKLWQRYHKVAEYELKDGFKALLEYNKLLRS